MRLFDWDDRKRLAVVYQQAADESSLEPSTDTEKHYAGLIAVASFAADEAETILAPVETQEKGDQ